MGCGESDVVREIRRAEDRDVARVEAAAAEAEQFLADAGAQEGAETLPSGLIYEVLSRGANQTLPRPGADAIVLVHYEGQLANGDVFDSSFARGEPAEFPLRQVVPGFAEAITQMRPGDEIIAYLPAELGYGARGQPPRIPPNSVLRFRILLLAYQGSDGRMVQAPRG
jgi:FKBP-type peptidyl-prolyl cis-trans isomerase FkpA/FKBP-type peptidyl-prolyl cis-trans isomerase FklB